MGSSSIWRAERSAFHRARWCDAPRCRRMCWKSSRREGLSRSFGRSSHRNRRSLSPDRPRLRTEELDYVRWIPVRRKDRVEHLPHTIALENERETLQEDLILERKGRQAEGSRPRSIPVAEEFEREVEPLDRLSLPLRRVDADAVHFRAEPSQILVKVSVCARFGRAPSSSRDQVPLLWRRGVGPPGVRIHEHDQGPAHVGKVDGSARRGTQGNVREAGSGEMIASPVVEWNWEIRWEGRRRQVGHWVVARISSRKGHRDPAESAVGLTLNKVNR